MLRAAIHDLLSEPRVADPPERVWRDYILLAAIITSAGLEALLAPDVVWRPAALVLCVALAPTVLWRRTHPLGMLAVGFGGAMSFNIAAAIMRGAPAGLYTNIFVLVFCYTLFRWASGRDALIGVVILIAVLVAGIISDPGAVVSDAIGGLIVLALPMAFGEVVRVRVVARTRLIDEIKLLEREQLARELHDTVAHHVSAIAIQAQAGRVLSTTRPEAAVEALAIIEEAASRTLEDMRSMVAALRSGDEAQLAPQHGIADLHRLSANSGERLEISVEVDGDIGNVRPAVDAAIYRIAQESVTNAVRHARNGSSVLVRVEGDLEAVRLTVSDNGHGASFDAASSAGYGLLGMAERAKVLGGHFSAGPHAGHGWLVSAEFPRTAIQA